MKPNIDDYVGDHSLTAHLPGSVWDVQEIDAVVLPVDCRTAASARIDSPGFLSNGLNPPGSWRKGGGGGNG